jgi:hypothetical protein
MGNAGTRKGHPARVGSSVDAGWTGKLEIAPDGRGAVRLSVTAAKDDCEN